MRVGHRMANLPKQAHSLRPAQLAFPSPGVDGQAVDVLHHEIEQPGISAAAVVQPRDVLMFQIRQQFAFAAEAFLERSGGVPDEFESYRFAEGIVGTFGQIHAGHSTAADFPYDLIIADNVAWRGEVLVGSGLRIEERLAAEQIPGCREGFRHVDSRVPECGVVAEAGSKSTAIRFRDGRERDPPAPGSPSSVGR